MKGLYLGPVRPNAGTEARYRRQLAALVEEMAASVTYWLKAQYKETPPAIAEDELPSEALRREVRKLARRWQKKFDEAAPKMAAYYAKSAERRSAKALEGMLREAGMTVRFKMTREAKDVMNASLSEQVGLIKSIPSQYFTEVEGLVMRSVSAGRDLKPLADALQERYSVTKRRAQLIARDQNNKATASMTRVRHLELGVTEAVWLHSHGGKKPRPTHLANSGKRYSIAEGWLDPHEGKRIWPGELINCRCVAKPVVEGFS